MPAEIDVEASKKWEETADAELEEYISQNLEDSAEVRKLLTIQRGKKKTAKFSSPSGEVEIAIQAVVPYQVRARALQLETEAKRIAKKEQEDWEKISAGEAVEITETDPLEVQKPMYEMIASLCIEKPWTDWRTWYAVDRATGTAPEILETILATIEPEEARIRKFRPKR